jgi:diguanylate cyclase (GGDEF)-like protein
MVYMLSKQRSELEVHYLSPDVSKASIVFFLDGFIDFRQQYGFDLGEKVLNHVESVATETLDAARLIRTPDDGFIALVPCSLSEAAERVDRLRSRIGGSKLRFTVDGQQIAHSVTLSAGLSEPRTDGLDAALTRATLAYNQARAQSDATVVYQDQDPLTGLVTGQTLSQTLSDAVWESTPDTPLSLIELDIDSFATFEATNGREDADQLLILIASRLTNTFGQDCTVGRLWSDTFLVIIPGGRAEDVAFRAETFRRELASSDTAASAISLSLGIAAYPKHASDSEELQRKAREARYQSRQQGGATTSVAEADQMVTKTSHFTRIQLKRLATIAKQQERSEASLLREGLDTLLQIYDDGAPT